MHIPIPGVIDGPSARFNQPYDDPFDRPAHIFVPQIEPANQMEQVEGEKAHLDCYLYLESLLLIRLEDSLEIIRLSFQWNRKVVESVLRTLKTSFCTLNVDTRIQSNLGALEGRMVMDFLARR